MNKGDNLYKQTGEYVIPPDDQVSDPSSKRSKIITEFVCSTDGSCPKPATSSTGAVASGSASRGFYHYVGNEGEDKRRNTRVGCVDGFVDDGDHDGPDHGMVDSSSDEDDDDDRRPTSMCGSTITTLGSTTASTICNTLSVHPLEAVGSGDKTRLVVPDA